MQLTVTWRLAVLALAVAAALWCVLAGLRNLYRGPQSDWDFVTPALGAGAILVGLALLAGLALGWWLL